MTEHPLDKYAPTMGSLNRRIEQLEAEVEKWHRVAMEAGAITCSDGRHIYPRRERIEQLEAALRDYLMFLRKSVNVGPLTKNPSKEAAHLRRLIALIPDVAALAPEQDK